jgi:acetyl-CoA carboxylase carboxyltransferase component
VSVEKPELAALLSQLADRDARAEEGGGRARQDRHRRLGRLTARERIAALVDPGSFSELGKHLLHRHSSESDLLAANRHPGDGLVVGLARVDGRPIAVYAHDPTVLRGAVGLEGANKVCRLQDLAFERRLPVVAFADSDGVRVEEGTDAIDAYGEILARTIRGRERSVQLTLVSGLCVGAAAYNAALTDAVGMIEGQSYMFITGPKVTKVVTGEDVELKDLGGTELHAKKTGACHAVLKTEADGIAWLKRLLGFAARSRVEGDAAAPRDTPELEKLIPLEARRAYDTRKLLAAVFDPGSLLELSEKFAPNLCTAFARLCGEPVAIVASNPMYLAGCLDIDASRKGAAFIEWATRLRLPICTFVDVPGYLPGRKQEEGGIIPHGATLLTAYGKADVPTLCLVVRKSFGGASVLSFAADVRLALPTARIGPMGADATLEVVLGPAPDDPALRADREKKREAWLARHDHAFAAAETGYIDRVVPFAAVRRELSIVLSALLAG